MEKVKEILLSPVFITIAIIAIGIGVMAFFVARTNNEVSSYPQQPYATYEKVAGKPLTAETKLSEEPKVIIEEFGDFQCPACGALYQSALLEDIQIKYGDKVKFVFRQYPLTSIHPYAFRAAEASLAAGNQGKFWEMYDVIFQNQARFGNPATGPNLDDLVNMAKEIGVADIEKFKTEVSKDAYRDAVRKDMDIGNQKGVSGTPSIFINDKLYDLREISTIEDMSAIIDKILSQ